MLLISLLGARLISMLGTSALGNSAANLGSAVTVQRITRYPLAGSYTLPTSAMATASWLVYTATDSTHQTMIFAENRQTRRIVRLLLVPANSTLTVRALTDQLGYLESGDGTVERALASLCFIAGRRWYRGASPAGGYRTSTSPTTLDHSGWRMGRRRYRPGSWRPSLGS